MRYAAEPTNTSPTPIFLLQVIPPQVAGAVESMEVLQSRLMRSDRRACSETDSALFRGRHFEAEIIMLCVSAGIFGLGSASEIWKNLWPSVTSLSKTQIWCVWPFLYPDKRVALG